MKNKFKSYAFCIGVCVSVVALVVTIGNVCGIKVNEIALTSVFTAVLGVFVALGMVQKEEQEIDDNMISDETFNEVDDGLKFDEENENNCENIIASQQEDIKK